MSEPPPNSSPPLRAAIIPVTPLQQNCSLIWCTETMFGALVTRQVGPFIVRREFAVPER